MVDARIITVLTASPLFSGLHVRDVNRVAAFCRMAYFRKGNIVFVEGERPVNFYIVASGQVKVFKGSAEGREVILKIMRHGELVGEAAALAGKPYPASAQAITDASAVEVPRRDFVELIKNDPSLALKVIAALSERLHQISGVLEKLTLKEVPARLAAYLLENATRAEGGEQVVEFQIAKATLAAELGTVPEVLSRALTKFAAAGFIVVEGKKVVLKDVRALQLLAAGQGG